MSYAVTRAIIANRVEVTRSPTVGVDSIVSVLGWRSGVQGGAGAVQFRLTMGPLELPGATPNPPGALIQGHPAGGSDVGTIALMAGQPTRARVLLRLSWGVGAYLQELIADWPVNGGGVDFLADSFNLAAIQKSPSASFGEPAPIVSASAGPGDRGSSELVPLVFSQVVTTPAASTRFSAIPRFAQQLDLSSRRSNQVQFCDPLGNFLTDHVTSLTVQRMIVPARAQVFSMTNNDVSPSDCYLTWIISP